MSNKLYESVLEAIGNTPLVALDRLTAKLEGRILAKLDYLNPGFSKKDRAALEIVLEAERSGELQPGQTVVELTSGNMGTGLAIVCSVRGYPFVAVMSEGNSRERAEMMRSLGAEVVLVPQAPGSIVGEVSGEDLGLVDHAARRITEERSAFRADQFHHRGNPNAHYKNTGPEIWRQSGGSVTAFCDLVGSAGTFAGVAKYLKEQEPRIRCFVVEPEGAAALAAQPVTCPNHPIQGGGYAMPELQFIDQALIDGFVQIDGETATRTTRLLAEREGIFAGFSSGANVAAAMRLLEGDLRGEILAVVICDSGLKYLSTDLWTQQSADPGTG